MSRAGFGAAIFRLGLLRRKLEREREGSGTVNLTQAVRLAVALGLRPDRVEFEPEFAKIELTTRCNLGCSFCDLSRAVGTQPRAGTVMPADRLAAVLDAMPRLRWLDIQGVGEPLAHPEFDAILELLQARDIQIEVTTNGLLLGDGVRSQLLAGVAHRIAISLPAAAPDTFERLCGQASLDDVLSHTRALVAERGPARSPEIRFVHVPLAYTLDETEQIVRLAAECGVDQLVLSRYQPAPGDDPLEPCPTRLAASIRRARALALRLKVTVEVVDARFASSDPTDSTRWIDRCYWPWTAPMIDVNGTVRPCCYAPRADGLGDAFTQPFSELWNGNAYRRFRSSLRGHRVEALPCARCQEAF